MKRISYRKTVVGWYNFDNEAGETYNVNPETFREITGVSKRAVMGCVELTEDELQTLTAASRFIKLPEGHKWAS
ncbi:hypothetical protein [Lederbergia citri]|uniref:Uncharacterized protein n=1 Tax=Lederbergia citri TaxID=2833580 RepID=A0A942TBX2_9BACI|nr:hypothetical protein [Lederbergia citri]MBS4193477.1 hypothetical protein [Lederbergia citri]